MELIDVLNKLRAIENPTEEVKEAIAQTKSMTVTEDMDTVAAIINDIMDHDPSDESVMGYISKHSDKLTDADYEKLHAELSDMGYDAEVIADLIEASEDMVAPEMEPDMAVVVEPEMAPAVEPDMQNKDEAVDMAHGQLEFIKYASQEIEDYLMRGMPLPEWMQNKLSRMHGNIMNLHAYIEGEEGKAGLNESKSQGDAWYAEQRAKEAYEKANPGKRWADLPYGYKEDWRMKTESVSEGMYDGKSREELLKMKAQAEADIKNMQSSGDGPQQKFYDETQMMMAQQHLDDINNALKKVSEGQLQIAEAHSNALLKKVVDQIKQDADAERWNEIAELLKDVPTEWLQSFLSNAAAERFLAGTDETNPIIKYSSNEMVEASGEFAQPFYDMLDQYSGGEQIPQPWKTIIDQFVMDLDADEVEEFVDRFRREHDMEESIEAVEEEAVEETVQVPVSELQDLLRLAGVDASIEEWANTPMGSEEEPIYGDAEEQVIGLAGGLNRPKNQHSTAKDGDNAMAVESIKERLWAALQEQKEQTEEGRGRGRGKKKTDEDEEVATEGRGRGKTNVMAGRGRGKTNVMAGRGRGKN